MDGQHRAQVVARFGALVGVRTSSHPRAHLAYAPPPEGMLFQSISATSSTSTAMSNGSLAMPTAERAWRPASPKTSISRSLQPLITAGVSLKLGWQLTI